MAQKTIVGLDIGTTRLRAVEAVMNNGKPKIIGVASAGLPEGTVVGGELQDVHAFTDALKNLWKVGKFTSKDARVIINSEQNVSTLSTLDDEIDFNRTLPFRLKAKDAFQPSEFYISYHTIRKYEVQEEDRSHPDGFKTVPKRDIFLAAAKRNLIDAVLRGFDGTDIRLLSIDIAPLALIRSESDIDSENDEDEIDIHVNVGGDSTILVVSNRAQPVYVRVINLGGNTITDSIAEQLDVSWEDAEKLKLGTLTMNPKLLQRPLSAGNVFGDESDAPENDGQSEYSFDQMDAYEIVNNELAAIIENISQTILYFINENQYGLGDNIDNVYLSGGTAAFGKIRHHLYHEINARQTSIAKPLNNMLAKGLVDEQLVKQFDPIQHEFSLAIGAVLGQGGEKND